MPRGEEGYVRRVASVLVAERQPGAGAPEAAGADAVGGALALLRTAGGDAERLGAESLVSGFDQPAMAVAAASRLHLDGAGARDDAPAQWRVGIHVGEVMMRADAAATRAAIHDAARLAGLARPGTTAVAAGALTGLGSLRDVSVEVLETPHLPDASGDVVHLLVPHAHGPWRERRLLVAALGATALASAASLVWIARRRAPGDDRPRHVTLAVGSFQSSRIDPEHAWMGGALRTGLTTQLSELSGAKVYAQAFLDFLMAHEKLSEIEVATRLGIEKMLTGSVLVVGDSVRVEVQVVDVMSGLLEGAYATVGQEANFLALENDVVLGVISKLDLRLSSDDERRLAARRSVNPETFRRFFDAEGGGALPAPVPEEGAPRPPSSWRLGPSAAYADDTRAEVMALLEDYRRKTEAHDVDALAQMYLSFVPKQRVLLERYFANLRNLKVRIEDVDVAIAGDEAIVSYTRVDDFVDIPTDRMERVSLRVTRTLRRLSGQWRFASVQ